jgi:spore maturation protein CgeB
MRASPPISAFSATVCRTVKHGSSISSSSLRPACFRAGSFLLGGSGWQRQADVAEIVNYIGHVSTRDHNAFNVTPKAVLNISRASMAENGFSPATRVFEAAGAGACLITDYWEGIELFLKPDEEILVARDGQDVADILCRADPQRPSGSAANALTACWRNTPTPIAPRRSMRSSALMPRADGGRRMTRPLDIVFLGLSLVFVLGQRPRDDLRALIRGLTLQGHRVLFLERDVPWYASQRDLADPDFCELAYYSDIDE